MSTHAIPPLIGLAADPDVGIGLPELVDVAAALQAQITHDVAPAWHTTATIAAFDGPDRIPTDYWPVIVKTSLDDPGALGYHDDPHHRPTSYVQAGSDWPVTASHEVIEMLVDPWGYRLVACDDPRGVNYGRAHVLVEACDPCEAYTYPSLGVAVSDFVEPNYYGSHHWAFGRPSHAQPASHLGHVQPMQVAPGGYLSWLAADGHWWQRTYFGNSPADRELGDLRAAIHETGSPRAAIDVVTREAAEYVGRLDYGGKMRR